MLMQWAQLYGVQIQTFFYLITIINGILHFIFASAVAKDAGRLHRLGVKPVLVAAPTWAFATLIGGVFTATIYWLLHHSTLTRPLRDNFYDKLPNNNGT